MKVFFVKFILFKNPIPLRGDISALMAIMTLLEILPNRGENTDVGGNFGLKFPSTLLLRFNSFPHDKILGQTKLKAFADDKLNVKKKMLTSVFDRVKNIVGKGEIACTSNFSFSYNVFKRLLPIPV